MTDFLDTIKNVSLVNSCNQRTVSLRRKDWLRNQTSLKNHSVIMTQNANFNQITMNIINTLKGFGYIRTAEEEQKLSPLSVRELITDYILPRVVEVGGQDIRGWRLSPTFMKLMTIHGQDFVAGDQNLGELLYELALQRITRHPDLLSIDYIGILPVPYRKYSAAYDQTGMWGDEEIQFMQEQFANCLNLSTPAYRDHAKNLLLEILEKSTCNQNGCNWCPCNCKMTNAEFWKWVCTAATDAFGIQYVAQHLAKNNWHRYIDFYALYSSFIDFDGLFEHIDLDKETYYTGVKRFFLKAFGLYKGMTRSRILREINRVKD